MMKAGKRNVTMWFCPLPLAQEAGRTSAVGLCVKRFLQHGRRRWRVVFLSLAVFVAALPHGVFAHKLFMAYVQHGVHLSVGARNIDLTFDLTFFEQWSAKERLAMDADGNGLVSRSEVDAYVKKLAPRISRQVKLRVAGRELPLAQLYDPEIDLLGNDRVGPAHHNLRIFFFAVTPTTMRAGDEIVIEDSLWPKAKALGTLRAEGNDGAALETEKEGNLWSATTQAGVFRRFTARCLKPPTIKPNVTSKRHPQQTTHSVQ